MSSDYCEHLSAQRDPDQCALASESGQKDEMLISTDRGMNR